MAWTCSRCTPLGKRLSLVSELSETDGLLIRGNHIIIPESLREEIIEWIHEGHLGLTKYRERAQTSVWWPGLRKKLWTQLPYLIYVSTKEKTTLCSDYYSRFLEILHLSNTTVEQVIIKLKATFARFGIPEVVVSDNGPQFMSKTFRSFSHEFDCVHIISSPHHPLSNGHAECAVQSAKAILQHKDPVLALLSYRTTPHASSGVSPAQL